MVEDNFSEALLDGVVQSGDVAEVDVEDDKIVIRRLNQRAEAEAETENVADAAAGKTEKAVAEKKDDAAAEAAETVPTEPTESDEGAQD